MGGNVERLHDNQNKQTRQTNKQTKTTKQKREKKQTKTMITRTPGTATFTSPVSKLYGIAFSMPRFAL